MKKILNLLILLSGLATAQLTPTIGGRYTGGLSYEQDHEYFSLEVGATYKFGEYDNPGYILSDELTASYEFIYDSTRIFTDNRTANLYGLRLTSIKFFTDILALSTGVSYINTYDKPFIKPNLGYNIGVAVIDDSFSATVSYENINGYGYGSLGVMFKLWEIYGRVR